MEDSYSVSRLWLVRHAPVFSSNLYGHTDVPADFSDNLRLDQLALLLPDEADFISSDLQRCTGTAVHILDRKSLPLDSLKTTPDLREQNFGSWENRTYREIENSDPEAYTEFWQDPSRKCPPGGESFEDMVKRVETRLDSLLSVRQAEDMIFVVHAGTIRAMLGLALSLQPTEMLSFQIEPLSLTRLTVFAGTDGRHWQIGCVNSLTGTELDDR